MSHPLRSLSHDRIGIEFVEADVEIGFGLIDDARAYQASGQSEFSSRALRDAAAVVADIETRTKQLAVCAAQPFLPLLAELRYEIDSFEQGSS